MGFNIFSFTLFTLFSLLFLVNILPSVGLDREVTYENMQLS